MPVTVKIAQRAPQPWLTGHVVSEDVLFRLSCTDEYQCSKGIIQSSFPEYFFQDNVVSPASNGFVQSALHAYNGHQHLIIRPDDVWCAILSQIGFYINAHAEELRHVFVFHQGRKELEVLEFGPLKASNFGKLAITMSKLIQENVVDPDIRDWIMPSFSTTTDTDRVVASVLLMGAMQKYFTYKERSLCGLPAVTLLGDKKDWCDIAERIPLLEKLGSEPTRFTDLLKPVLRNFIRSFDRPSSDETINFWDKIAHYDGGSGDRLLSGWITAFCFWSNEGERLLESVPARKGRSRKLQERGGFCELNGVSYHRVNSADIPSGFSCVPLTLDDHGTIYHTRMLAGLVGKRACHESDRLGEVFDQHVDAKPTEFRQSAVQPLSGWWVYEVKDPGDEEDRESQQHSISEPKIIRSGSGASVQEVGDSSNCRDPRLWPREAAPCVAERCI